MAGGRGPECRGRSGTGAGAESVALARDSGHLRANAAVVGPDVCLSCHTHEQNPNFDYEEALKHIVHWRQ